MSWDDYFTGAIQQAWAEGCPICSLVQEAERRRHFYLVQEELNSPPAHEAFARGRGLCHRHAWLLHDTEAKIYGSQLGTAMLYENLINLLAADLRKAAGRVGRRSAGPIRQIWYRFLKRPASVRREPCWICTSLETTASDYIHFLLRGLENDVAFAEGYRVSAGLCLTHLMRALPGTTGRVRSLLLDKALGDLAGLKGQISEYIRKHDYRFHNEPEGPEQSSVKRVSEFCVGPRGYPAAGGSLSADEAAERPLARPGRSGNHEVRR